MDKKTERMVKEVEKELRALRAKAKQKKDPKFMKAYHELASTLR